MKILYVSNYNDEDFFKYIFDNSIEKPIQNIQKFNKLFVSGIENNPQVNEITVLTSASVNRSISRKIFWKGKNIKINKTKFCYIPFINLKLIKQLCLFIFSILFTLIWCIKNCKKECVLISDGFFPVVSTVSTIFCKIFKIPVMTLYTDLPKCSASTLIEKTTFRKFVDYIINFGDRINIKCSNMFVLLTEAMNEIVNKKNKPYIVMEGLVDSKFNLNDKKVKKKKAIMYAGGLYEKYGVKLLIDSFIAWNNKDYELWLCGNGDLVDYIKKIKMKNVKYFGTLPNNKIVQLEKEATLLVNPRFSNEEYTKYSFPSKNMEYMLSGTPVLTTKLPGMPKEYKNYVYLVEEETIEGYINIFNNLLLKNLNSLNKLGTEAQNFVLKEKNNVVQAQRICQFVNNNIKRSINNINIVNRLLYLYLFINIILLSLSSLNIFGLYSVSKETYGIYILNIIFTIVGLKFKIKKTKEKEECDNAIGSVVNKEIQFFRSNVFKYFLLFVFCFVLIYFIKYLYVIKDLPKSEIRMAAFDKLYSNAFSAVFYLYVVTNCVRFIELLLVIFLFDKKLKNIVSNKIIYFMVLIILIYTFIGFSRMSFLFIIILSLLAVIYFADIKKMFSKKNIIKISVGLISIFILSCFMIFFRINSDTSIFGFCKSIITQFEQIFIYFLGAFRALDHFIINGFNDLSNLCYGRATFAGFEEIVLYPIKFFGSEIFSFNQIISVHTQTAISVGEYTNYYNAFFTSVMNFYLDFRVIGVIIFSFIHGLFIKYIIDLYKNNKSIILKCSLLFVSYNLLVSSLKWEYQSGNTIFFIIILLFIEFISTYNIRRKKL